MVDNANILDRQYQCNKTLFSAAGGSADTRTFPGEIILIDYVFMTFTSIVTAGNRRISVEIRDANSNLVASFTSPLSQPASDVRSYMFIPGVPREQGLFNSTVTIPIANHLVVPPLHSLFIGDINAFEAGDSYEFGMGYRLIGEKAL